MQVIGCVSYPGELYSEAGEYCGGRQGEWGMISVVTPPLASSTEESGRGSSSSRNNKSGGEATSTATRTPTPTATATYRSSEWPSDMIWMRMRGQPRTKTYNKRYYIKIIVNRNSSQHKIITTRAAQRRPALPVLLLRCTYLLDLK